ncbi:hypothetical protein AAG906_008955 [Vitis piasezkii]
MIIIVINGKGFQENLIRNYCRNKTEANVLEKASALVAAEIMVVTGKLYYLDLRSKDSNKLQQALMTEDEVNLLFQNFINDNGGEYQSSIFKSIWKDMASFIKLLVPIHPSKMESLSEKSALVRGCSCFLDSKNTDILLGEAITSRILDQSVPSRSINFQTPLQALTNALVAPTVPNLPPRVLVARHLCIYTSTNAPS